MGDEDYKLKRERNNRSVQKCRSNEKQKIESAKIKLRSYKEEEKELDEKFSNLQKELEVLKSLFQSSAASNQSQLNLNFDTESSNNLKGKSHIEISENDNKIPKSANDNSSYNRKSNYKTLDSLLSSKTENILHHSYKKLKSNQCIARKELNSQDHEYALRRKYSKNDKTK